MKSLLTTMLCLITVAQSLAQGSNCFQFGFMPSGFKSTEYWKDNVWPGFSIETYGISFSYFRGKNNEITPPSNYPVNFDIDGHFFDFGYRRDFAALSPLKKVFKRDVLTPSLGIGIGTFGIKSHNAFQFNVRPGIKFSPIPGVAAFVNAYTGYAKFSVIDDGDPNTVSEDEKFQSTLKGWFVKPVLGIELSTNLDKLIGDVWIKKDYDSGGWRSYTYTGVDGNVYSRHYYQPPGDYISSYVTHSKNVLNAYGKIGLPIGEVNRAMTLTGAAGLALRYGMFAMDLEHQQGRVGYSYGADNWSVDERMQCYWNAQRTSFCAGIDMFGIPRPFKLPSFFRVIIGTRMGIQTLNPVLNDYAEHQVGVNGFEKQSVKNKFFRSYFYALELGTLGLGFDYYSSKDQLYKSGFLLTARYMIPLVSAN